jgi:hypothetical protein
MCTMFVKRTRDSIAAGGKTVYWKELKYLYARRSAVDALIQSLQEYNHFRSKAAVHSFKRKSA